MAEDHEHQQTPVELALDSVNAGYVAELYEQYRRDPASVDREWRDPFREWRRGLRAGTGPRGDPSRATSTPGSGTPPMAAAGCGGSAPGDPSGLPRGRQPDQGSRRAAGPEHDRLAAVPTATSFRDVEVTHPGGRRRELNGRDRAAQGELHAPHRLGHRAGGRRAAGMTHYFAEADGAPHRVDPGAVNLGLAVDVERRDGSRFLWCR